MSRIIEALRRLEIVSDIDESALERVVILRNFSFVRTGAGAINEGFGFKFVVLDRDGLPVWFGRCGWDSLDAMRRENNLLRFLSAHAEAGRFVAETRSIEIDGTSVQAMRFLGRRTYSSLVERRNSEDWAADVRSISHSASVTTRAASGFFLAEIDPFSFRVRQLEEDIARLRSNGFSSRVCEEAGGVLTQYVHSRAAALQHGDLWPPNVISHSGRWWLIDFSECGLVWTMGHDLLHLLVNGPLGFQIDWIDGRVDDSGAPLNRVRRLLLREFAQENELDPHSLGSHMIAYLTRMAAHRLRPGVPAHLSQAWTTCLSRIVSGSSVQESAERIGMGILK